MSEITFEKKSRRIALLDELRGFCVICMVFYHTLYTFGIVFNFGKTEDIFNFFYPLEPVFAALFIFISGICTKLSRSNLKRGTILLVIALGINLFTAVFLPSFVIAFGVLNLLSVCMILYGLFGNVFNKINPIVGFTASMALFALTYGIDRGYIGLFTVPIFSLPKVMYRSSFLFPFGFICDGFHSSDYFPIFPWIFMFISGAFFACYISRFTLPEKVYNGYIPWLAKTGRHALFIYVVHQPIIFISAYLINLLQ